MRVRKELIFGSRANQFTPDRRNTSEWDVTSPVAMGDRRFSAGKKRRPMMGALSLSLKPGTSAQLYSTHVVAKLVPSVDKGEGVSSVYPRKSTSVTFNTDVPKALIAPLWALSVASFVPLISV
jgi:hypothetical protein